MSSKKLIFTNSIGNNLANAHNDILSIKKIMKRMNRLILDSRKAEPHGYLKRELDNSIKSYQKDKGLQVDGRVFPNGETHQSLSKDWDSLIGEEDQWDENDWEEGDGEDVEIPDLSPSEVEREELPPPNIPGTNIPDRGVPEQGVERNEIGADKDQWRYKIDSGIIVTPPVMDRGIDVPVIDDIYGPWTIPNKGKKI
jgi:hypothetical protein